MIVLLHAALGGTLGARVRSRPLVTVLGIGLHLVADGIPHEDTDDEPFEIATGLLALALLAARRGLLEPATIGAAACCLPDAEHLVPLPRPGGSKLFHDRRGWHRSGGLSVASQLLIAGVLLGRLLVRRPA